MAVKHNNIQYRCFLSMCWCTVCCYIMLNIFYDFAEEEIIASLM